MFQTPQYVPMPQHQQNEQLRQFWMQQHREIAEVGTDPAEFKNHQLPLARIKKVCTSSPCSACLQHLDYHQLQSKSFFDRFCYATA